MALGKFSWHAVFIVSKFCCTILFYCLGFFWLQGSVCTSMYYMKVTISFIHLALHTQVSLYYYRKVSSTSSDRKNNCSDINVSMVFVGEDLASSMYASKFTVNRNCLLHSLTINFLRCSKEYQYFC